MQYQNLIIDGNNFLFRSFYARTNRPSRIVGDLDTKPLYQALHMLKSLVERHPVANVYFTWDKRLNPDFVNFRRELLPEYKENRVDTDDKREVLSYMQHVVWFCDALGIRTIYPYDLEADDVIKYIADKSESSLIVSSDRDLLQLVNGHTHLLIPTIPVIVTLENFEDYGEVSPTDFLLYKAIVGDKSDNIAGLYRYGPVKAKTLAEQLNRGEHVDLTEEQRGIIATNLRIVDLCEACVERPDEVAHYERQWVECQSNKFDADKLRSLFVEYGFTNLIREFGVWSDLFNIEQKDFSWDNFSWVDSVGHTW